MPVKNCSWGSCKSDSRYPERCVGVTFLPFVKPGRHDYHLGRCLRWIQACGRPHDELNPGNIKWKYICSKHFVDGTPTEENPDPVQAVGTYSRRKKTLQDRDLASPQVPADGPAFTVDQPGEMLHVSQTKSKKMKLAEGNSENSGSQVLADAAQGSSEHPAHFAKNRFPAAELAENTDTIQRDCSAKREVDPVGHVASDGMRLPSEIKREVVDVSDDGPEDRVEAMSRGVGGTLASSGSECIANYDVSCDSSEWWVKPVNAVRKVSSDSKRIGHRDVSKFTRLALSVRVKKDAGISDAPETAEYMTPGAQSEMDDPEDLLQLPVHFQSDAGGLPLLPEQVQFGSTTAEVAGLRDPSTQHSSVESFEDVGDSAELGQMPLSKVKTEHGVDEDETEFGHRPVPLSEVKIEIDVAEDMLDQLLMKGDSKGGSESPGVQDMAVYGSPHITLVSSQSHSPGLRGTAVHCISDIDLGSLQDQSPGTQSMAAVFASDVTEELAPAPSQSPGMLDVASSGSSETAVESSQTQCPDNQVAADPSSSSTITGLSQTFFCPTCALVFDFPQKLSEHLREHDNSSERPYSCDKCDIIINIVRVIERSCRSTKMEFPCDRCEVSFSQYEDLRTHLVSHAADTVRLRCGSCKACFLSVADLKQHRVTHAGPGPFYCRGCPASFSELTSLKWHMKLTEHPEVDVKQFPCDKCAAMFETVGDCKSHTKKPLAYSKSLKTLACNKCSATFGSRNALREHKKFHTELPTWRCQKCQDTIFGNSYLTKFLLKNPGVRLFECKDCDALMRAHSETVLPQLNDLSQPQFVSLHSQAILLSGTGSSAAFSASSKSPECGPVTGKTAVPSPFRLSDSKSETVTGNEEEARLVFCTSDDCTAERISCLTEYIHTHVQTEGVPAYFCTRCDAIFAQYGDLIAHMSVEHSEEEPFTCWKCPAAFSSHSELKEHMKKHGAKYFCEKCGDAFATSKDLTLHFTREHPGDKHFPCNSCDAIFFQQNSLKSHEDTHKNKEMFSCWDCSAIFAQKGSLVWHRKHKHKPDPKPPSADTSHKRRSRSGVSQSADTSDEHKSKFRVSRSADTSDKHKSKLRVAHITDSGRKLKSKCRVSLNANTNSNSSDKRKSKFRVSQSADTSDKRKSKFRVAQSADTNDKRKSKFRVSQSTDTSDKCKSKFRVSQSADKRKRKFRSSQSANSNTSDERKPKSGVSKNTDSNTCDKNNSVPGAHDASYKHLCHECHASFKQARSLKVHLRLHAKKVFYSCHICGATFKLARKWEAHLDGHAKDTTSAPQTRSERQRRRKGKARDGGSSKNRYVADNDTYRVVLKPM